MQESDFVPMDGRYLSHSVAVPRNFAEDAGGSSTCEVAVGVGGSISGKYQIATQQLSCHVRYRAPNSRRWVFCKD